jgi:Pvc16 N-terminal domain
MSNWLAVATVTAAVREVIETAIRDRVPGAQVTTVLPDAVDYAAPAVNVFLYAVARDATFANSDLPTRTQDRVLMQRPQTALRLHYLLMFLGDDVKFEPQRLLGATVARLHAQPELLRRDIALAIAHSAVLLGSDLASQTELVRFVSHDVPLDELSRLWPALLPKYCLARAYDAGVVLITEPGVTNAPLPVAGSKGSVTPGAAPVIESVASDLPMGRIADGSTLRIFGARFSSDATRVKIGNATIPVVPKSDSEIELTIHTAVMTELRAGVSQLYVLLGATTDGQWSVTSISQPFPIVVVPAVVSVHVAGDMLEVEVTPAVDMYQPAEGYLNAVGGGGTGVGLTAKSRLATSTLLRFRVAEVPSGRHLIRVAVDGVQSVLERGPDGYDKPVVEVP